MKIIILASGSGIRLYPLNGVIPKQLKLSILIDTFSSRILLFMQHFEGNRNISVVSS